MKQLSDVPLYAPPTPAIAQMLMYMAPLMPDRVDALAGVAALMHEYLSRGSPVAGWAELDMVSFVDWVSGKLSLSEGQRVAFCCDVSSVLAWIADSDELSAAGARKLFSGLACACPDEPEAQSYIRMGAEQFAGQLAN